MEKDKDACLRQLFDTLALQNNGTSTGGAGKCMMQGEVYLVSKACVYKGMPEEQDAGMVSGKVYPYDPEIQEIALKDINRIRPEVLLGTDRVQADECILGAELLPVANTQAGSPGIWLLHDAGDVYECVDAYAYDGMERMQGLPMQLNVVPGAVAQTLKEYGLSLADLRACLMCTVLGSQLVLVLTGDTGLLYLTFGVSRSKAAMKPVLLQDGTLLVGDGWNDSLSAFRKLIKKRKSKMKGLGNPITGKKAEMAPSAAALVAKANPKEPEVAEAVAADVNDAVRELLEQPEPQPVQEAEAQPVQQEVPVQEEAAVQPETPSQAPKAADTAKPVQRQKKAQRSAGIDFDKILENLSAEVEPITTPEQMDKANAEVKKCREIGKILFMRIANITDAISKSSKTAVQTLSGIRGLMK